MAVLALSQTLRQQQLKPLLHLAGGFIGEGHRQNLSWIGTVLSDQVSNPMGECPSFSTTCSCHHQQGTLVMIYSPSLGVIKASQKAHAILKEADEQSIKYQPNSF